MNIIRRALPCALLVLAARPALAEDVTGLMRDEAKARGIEPINDRVSTGRNIVNARSACRAFAEARWTR